MAHVGPKQKPQHTRNSFLREDRQRKAAEAKVRGDLRAKRSAQEQIALLDQRLGTDVGAVKERKRLRAFVDLGKSVERRHEAATVLPSQKEGMRKAFNATPQEMGKAAVEAARAAQTPQRKARQGKKARKALRAQPKGP